MGSEVATLSGKVKKGKKTSTKVLATFKPVTLTKPGSVHLKLLLPAAARKLGSYTLKVVSTAPDGTTHTTTTLKLEVKK